FSFQWSSLSLQDARLLRQLLYSIKPTSPCQELTVTFIPFFILNPENPTVVMFSDVQFFIENVIYWFIILPFGYCKREFTNFLGVNLIQKTLPYGSVLNIDISIILTF
ncbi:hypothetical protein, partial [Lactococcus lactis]|uniref:hypothetical protein n=5 Tax=Lactococcus lactis TaxID=1358 RepID=UPI0020131589